MINQRMGFITWAHANLSAKPLMLRLPFELLPVPSVTGILALSSDAAMSRLYAEHPGTHVQDVAAVKSIVALRIHLDDCPEENGALRVVRQSHRNGRLSSNELKSIVDGLEAETVAANARDVLAMSPLILHGSGKSTQPNRRRVLHVEYSCIELPAPLEWPSWEASMITSSIND